MKKTLLFILFTVLLLNVLAVTSYAAEQPAINAEIKAGKAGFKLTAGEEGDEYLVTVLKPGTDPATYSAEDIIYYNIFECDHKGEFEFGFSVMEYRGEFPCVFECSDKSYKIYDSFEYSPTGDNSFGSFKLNGTNLSVNDNMTLTVSYNTDVTGLIAEFTVRENAYVYVGEVLQKSGYTRNNFTNPVIYTVVADDGSEKNYTVTVNIGEKPKASGSSGGGGGGGGGASTKINYTPVPEEKKEENEETINEEPRKETVKRQIYSDMNSEHWAFDSVDMLKSKKVVSGYPDGSFRPEQKITRAEFLKIIINAFTLVPGVEETGSFIDVGEEDWYKYYVDIASSNGIVKGDQEGKFMPDEKITRQDMSVILWRVLGSPPAETQSGFEDIGDVSDYAKEAVEYLCAKGYLNGYPDNTVRGKNNSSRAEVCSIISKILKGEN